ncbi:matrixin family metalloprotease [Nocardioides acrostichi]|uniref:Matrixin family metalloprotease n=1 Tax=Nocardioides acrostichi TaxID=2784339 RepID=A0A930V1P0_9ACTN|nr:matrixin family metalloprotease [Nocardioides acrostichi]MBF4162256.1 matrixin family metalloprotease [Nocardioides acrostichi]
MSQESGSRPSAADLGVSQELYDRIVADLDRSRSAAHPVPEPARAPRLGGRSRLMLGALGALVFLVLHSVSTSDADDGQATFAFLHTQSDGTPVAYTSCRPIQVAVYPAGGPPDAEALVADAVAVVRAATGLDIVVTGSFGGAAPNWNFAAAPVTPDDPISVSWQDGAAIADMTDETAGLGGSRVFTNPDGSKRLGAGTIALSRDYYAELADEDDRAEEVAVIEHEFGHVLGLDHVDDRGELMNAANLGQTSFGAGDLEGLRRLGQGRCL